MSTTIAEGRAAASPPAESPPAAAAPAADGKPVKWWQWIIVYPALAMSLSGNVPALVRQVEAWLKDAPADRITQLQTQLRLLKENLPCTQEAMNHASKMRNSEIAIGTAVCERGDVAIVAQSPDAGAYPLPVIVPFDQLLPRPEAKASAWNLVLPISTAHAQAFSLPSAQLATVICQRPPDAGGNFLRRIKKPDGQCVDVITNVYNGRVVSETPAPCEPTC